MGVLKSKEKIKGADIVLYLYDVNEMSRDELETIVLAIRKQNSNIIVVANKADTFTDVLKHEDQNEIIISAREKTGIDELKNKLFEIAGGEGINTENIIVTNARHYAALQEVSKSLKEIKLGIANNLTGDLLSIDINRCLHYLGEISGEITNEDRLDYIFSKFCIGK